MVEALESIYSINTKTYKHKISKHNRLYLNERLYKPERLHFDLSVSGWCENLKDSRKLNIRPLNFYFSLSVTGIQGEFHNANKPT